MQNSKHKQAFTLIELIVYQAIAIIVLVIAVNIGINVTVSHSTNTAKQEVYYSGRLIENQLKYQMHKAADIVTVNTVFDSDQGVLALRRDNPTAYVYFDTYQKQITSGDQSINIGKLRIKVGDEDYVDLSSDKVNVTAFRIESRTRGTEPKNIKIELSLESINSGSDAKYTAQTTIETSLAIKR